MEVRDAETGQSLLLNTRRSVVRQAYAKAAGDRKAAFNSLARSGKVDVIDVSTDGDALRCAGAVLSAARIAAEAGAMNFSRLRGSHCQSFRWPPPRRR